MFLSLKKNPYQIFFLSFISVVIFFLFFGNAPQSFAVGRICIKGSCQAQSSWTTNVNNTGICIGGRPRRNINPSLWMQDNCKGTLQSTDFEGGHASTSASELCIHGSCIGTWTPQDTDRDGVVDNVDNCPNVKNTDQKNTDGDSMGDACDPDDDNDTVLDVSDFCSTISQGSTTNNGGCPGATGSLTVDSGDYGRTDYKTIDVWGAYTLRWSSQYDTKTVLNDGITNYAYPTPNPFSTTGDLSWANKTRSYTFEVYNKSDLTNPAASYTVWISSNPAPSIDSWDVHAGEGFNFNFTAHNIEHAEVAYNSGEQPNPLWRCDFPCGIGKCQKDSFRCEVGFARAPTTYKVTVYNINGYWQSYTVVLPRNHEYSDFSWWAWYDAKDDCPGGDVNSAHTCNNTATYECKDEAKSLCDGACAGTWVPVRTIKCYNNTNPP